MNSSSRSSGEVLIMKCFIGHKTPAKCSSRVQRKVSSDKWNGVGLGLLSVLTHSFLTIAVKHGLVHTQTG